MDVQDLLQQILSVCLWSQTVATESKAATCSSCDSNSNNGDESKKDYESLQEAYEKMYTQWLKVWAPNWALNCEIQGLCDLNAKAEGKISELEVWLTEKDENLKSVTTELEITQNSLRLLNNGSSKLDHLISTGKSFGDHGGVRYKGKSSGSKTVFVKSGLFNSLNISVKKSNVKFVATT